MKKKILLIIGIVLLTCACSSSNLKSINLKTLNKMLDNKESFVLYLTDDDEGKVLKNTLLEVSKKNKLNNYYLNTAKLNDKDLKSLKEKFTFDETNIIIFVENGQEKTVLSRISDLYISQKNLEQELKLQGYIK